MANLKGTFEMKKALIALLFGLLTIPALADNTIVENLQELIETRDAITNAIVQKGGTVTSGALTNVPNEILSIPSGGGGGSDTLVKFMSRQTNPTWTVSASELSGLTAVGRGACSHTPGMVGIELPSTVTTIDQYAFEDTGLTSITIPDSVTSFGQYTFRNSSNLDIIDFGGTRSTIPTFGANMFSGIVSGYRVLVPSSLLDTWKATSGWSGSSVAPHIYPHIDFDPSTTYVVNAQGQVVLEEVVSGRLTDDTIDDWLNQGTVQCDGTETLVIGLGVQNITASVDVTFGPDYFYNLEFLDRELSDIERWSNYPWNFVTNSTLFFLDSSVDHTIK